MKGIICLDSYKGSLTSKQACDTVKEGLQAVLPDLETQILPLADGGEGTLSCIQATLETEEVHCETFNSTREEIEEVYLRSGKQAFIEVATSCGMYNHNNLDKPVEERTSYGVGRQIDHAIKNGAKEIYIALGGSCTNDAGIGLLEALGVEFFNSDKKQMKSLHIRDILSIEKVSFQNSITNSPEVSLHILSDVQNPLLGIQGATKIYGEQKGVRPENFNWFETTFKHLVNVIEEENFLSNSKKATSGAAGGIGFALMSLGATSFVGADFLIELLKLESKLAKMDFIVTGEGRTDKQTLNGKLPFQIAQLAKKLGKASYLISASIQTESFEDVLNCFNGCFSIQLENITTEESMKRGKELLYLTSKNLAKILKDLK